MSWFRPKCNCSFGSHGHIDKGLVLHPIVSVVKQLCYTVAKVIISNEINESKDETDVWTCTIYTLYTIRKRPLFKTKSL